MVAIWSPFCGYNLEWYMWSLLLKICHVIQIKFNHLVEENVDMIINLSTKRISVIRVTNITRSFTNKMAAETSLHRYGTKLRNCHPMYFGPGQYYVEYSSSSQFICFEKWTVNSKSIHICNNRNFQAGQQGQAPVNSFPSKHVHTRCNIAKIKCRHKTVRHKVSRLYYAVL